MKRYWFKTHSVSDPRPLLDMAPIKMPWWCTGFAGDGSYATIVCYLPNDANLYDYWDDAFEVETETTQKIVYTDRFPEPEWLKEAALGGDGNG